MTKTLAWAAAFAALVTFGQAATDGQDNVQVFSSNGIRGALEILRPQAERAIGRSIVIQFAASAVLRRRIEASEPFDVVIVTPQVVAALVETGRIALGTEVDVASVKLGVGIRAGQPRTDIGTPESIKRRLLAAESITFAKEGAASPAILSMFERLGIAVDIERKTVLQTISGRAAESVAGGDNELVFAPVSEILMVQGVELLGLLPQEFQRPIVMMAAMSANARSMSAGKALIAFLRSTQAAEAMKASGVEPVK